MAFYAEKQFFLCARKSRKKVNFKRNDEESKKKILERMLIKIEWYLITPTPPPQYSIINISTEDLES